MYIVPIFLINLQPSTSLSHLFAYHSVTTLTFPVLPPLPSWQVLSEPLLCFQLCLGGRFESSWTTLNDLFSVLYSGIVPFGYFAPNMLYRSHHFCLHKVIRIMNYCHLASCFPILVPVHAWTRIYISWQCWHFYCFAKILLSALISSLPRSYTIQPLLGGVPCLLAINPCCPSNIPNLLSDIGRLILPAEISFSLISAVVRNLVCSAPSAGTAK